MRFSFTFVLAVCAPLLAFAAPISLNPPRDNDSVSGTDMYSPGWKREVVHEDSVVSTDWKRGDATVATFPGHGWKRGDGTYESDSLTGKDWKA